MIEALAALRAGAQALLEAEGERSLAALLEQASIEIVGRGETWTMGARTVTAHRVALVVDAPAYVAIAHDANRLDAIRRALSAALRTPETELAEVTIVLRLPAAQRGWHHVYRHAGPREPDRPAPEAVLAGAIAVLEATREPAADRAAEMLRRASLEASELPSSAGLLARYVVRLDALDLARGQRDVDVLELVKRVVREAGLRPGVLVGGVEVAPKLPLAAPAGGRSPEQILVAVLAARGAPAIPVLRTEGLVRLAVAVEGELRIVDLIDDDAGGAARWAGVETVARIVVPLGRAPTEAEAAAACEAVLARV